MRIYKDLDLVEQLGTGVPRILQFYGQEHFHFSTNFLRMVLPATEPVGDIEQNDSNGLVDGLVESQRKIIKLIKANPRISKKEMAEQVGISTTAIDKNISMLKERELLRRIGIGEWQAQKHTQPISKRFKQRKQPCREMIFQQQIGGYTNWL